MSDHHLIVSLQTGLNPTRLPVPEHNVPTTIAAAYPFPIWRESYLTRVTGDRVPRKHLFPVLTEVVGAINQYLIV